MGLADLLVRKHTAIAKILVPASMAFGFMYTLQNDTNPLTEAKNAALGELFRGRLEACIVNCLLSLWSVTGLEYAGTPNAPVAYKFKRSSIGASGDSS